MIIVVIAGSQTLTVIPTLFIELKLLGCFTLLHNVMMSQGSHMGRTHQLQQRHQCIYLHDCLFSHDVSIVVGLEIVYAEFLDIRGFLKSLCVPIALSFEFYTANMIILTEMSLSFEIVLSRMSVYACVCSCPRALITFHVN